MKVNELRDRGFADVELYLANVSITELEDAGATAADILALRSALAAEMEKGGDAAMAIAVVVVVIMLLIASVGLILYDRKKKDSNAMAGIRRSTMLSKGGRVASAMVNPAYEADKILVGVDGDDNTYDMIASALGDIGNPTYEELSEVAARGGTLTNETYEHSNVAADRDSICVNEAYQEMCADVELPALAASSYDSFAPPPPDHSYGLLPPQESTDTISEESGFLHGALSRVEAERILTDAHAGDGTFLVRTKGSTFVLSVSFGSRFAHHILAQDDDGCFTMNRKRLQETCSSLSEVVHFLKMCTDTRVIDAQLTQNVPPKLDTDFYDKGGAITAAYDVDFAEIGAVDENNTYGTELPGVKAKRPKKKGGSAPAANNAYDVGVPGVKTKRAKKKGGSAPAANNTYDMGVPDIKKKRTRQGGSTPVGANNTYNTLSRGKETAVAKKGQRSNNVYDVGVRSKMKVADAETKFDGFGSDNDLEC